jgi:glutathione S-transferase
MPTLVTIPFSHFCEKARWALDHARVDYVEEGHTPLLHRRAVARVKGQGGSVPVLTLDGDGVLDDSSLIVRWADARASSDRKLLPSGGRELDEALALERHLDMELAPHVRRFAYFHILPDKARALELMRLSTPTTEHTIVRFAYPLLRRLMERAMRIDADHAERSRDKVRDIFEQMSRRLDDGRPFLMGDRFGAIDIAFAAFVSPLLAPQQHPIRRLTQADFPPGLRAEGLALGDTAAGRFALRVYRDHRVMK